MDRLSSSLNVANRTGLLAALALYANFEDAAYIFLCSIVKFNWSVLRQLLQRNWCPTSFAQLFVIILGFSGQRHSHNWIMFIAQSCAFWHIRNNITMEAKVIKQIGRASCRERVYVLV